MLQQIDTIMYTNNFNKLQTCMADLLLTYDLHLLILPLCLLTRAIHPRKTTTTPYFDKGSCLFVSLCHEMMIFTFECQLIRSYSTTKSAKLHFFYYRSSLETVQIYLLTHATENRQSHPAYKNYRYIDISMQIDPRRTYF